jgi:hypothetical protein
MKTAFSLRPRAWDHSPGQDANSSRSPEGTTNMKKLLSAVLALTLLGTAGASAQTWRGNGGSHFTQSRGYQDRSWHGGYRRDDRGNIDTQIGLGLGLFALGAILASQNQPAHYAQPAYDNGYYNNGYYGR